MSWANVKLIFARELRDQLRDRRILFTILILPLLLYPFLGLSLLQVAQFTREHATQILVLGNENVPAKPALISEKSFDSSLCSTDESKLLMLSFEKHEGIPNRDSVQQRIVSGEFDAVVYFPPNFGDKLNKFRSRVAARKEKAGDNVEVKVPEPELFYNTASDKSRIAYDRVDSILKCWRDSIVVDTLKKNRIPVATTKPFSVINTDVSREDSRRAAIWSKVLPFVVLIWALTGAFYPAIDVCAGEKERGTLETLLSSPAKRKEIVWGKLLTIMVFSMTTAILNMTSMGLTGMFLIGQFQNIGGLGQFQLGPPPVYSMMWLVAVLIPISALFSALSLAIAAFARSTKEGQYYLMPLLLLSLPLMMLPILPATELDLGTSLIPVTGVMLVLRNLIEGQYADALPFIIPTAGVTAICCLLAIRWATEQFNNESVLFRASERFQLGLWIRHVVRDREDLPTFTEAALCGSFLLLVRFFVSMSSGMPLTWPSFASKTVISLVALIATPAMLMAILLTRRPMLSLRLRWPSLSALSMGLLLAVVIHPAAMAMTTAVGTLYPFAPDVERQLQLIQGILNGAPGILAIIAVLALAPAVCEEIAFRGFILSGLQQPGRKWAAILLSSALFGAIHLVLQQSIPAFAVGVVIGYIAVQTKSIWPCIGFHFIYNSLGLLIAFKIPQIANTSPIVDMIFADSSATGTLYTWPLILISVIGSAAILMWFRRLDGATRSSSAGELVSPSAAVAK